MSKAKVYTEVNVLHPKEYWDYEALTVQWGSVISSPPGIPPLLSLLESFVVFCLRFSFSPRYERTCWAQ
jgi:hypothetical protein